MKKFRFKFSPLVWVLITLVILLSLSGVAWNIYNVIYFADVNPEKIVTTAIILALNLAITIYALSLIFYSKYVIKKDCVYMYFGFIRSKIKISDIIQFSHFKKSDKLVAYFNDEKYTVIVISPDNYEKFILAVREINPHIYYSSEIDGEETP